MTSKCIHFIAAPDVFGQNRSEKGSKMAPTLVKPMENHQMSSPGNILCMEYFLYIHKGFSYGTFIRACNLHARMKPSYAYAMPGNSLVLELLFQLTIWRGNHHDFIGFLPKPAGGPIPGGRTAEFGSRLDCFMQVR